ncbi:MAG: CRISPR-associated endonuclease Cas1 [Bacteroidia bacterium]|nr:CRISPR-associated endonuclease Cas1 [Bacteroidia bacterium]
MQVFINTYGAYLHVKEEMFEIKTKETGSEKVKLNHIAAKKVSSFVLSKGASISTDAIALAVKHNIDIVILESGGQPLGRFWHSRPGSTTRIRKRQLEASLNQEGLKWVKDWIGAKLQNQADYIQDLKKHRPHLEENLTTKQEAILQLLKKVKELQASNLKEIAESLRGLEGSAGRHYFQSLSISIPDAYCFSGRSFRPAKDPFNCMLNYAYGILYSRVEKALMLAGLDPYVGFLHRDDYNTKSLVFDFIEAYRIHADRCVFALFSRKKVKNSYWDEFPGGFGLNKEGKIFLGENFIRYLDEETIRHKGKNQTRINVIQLEAHHFAQQLLGNSNNGGEE